MSRIPENKLGEREARYGVYDLDAGGTAPVPEVTVFKNGSVRIVGDEPEDKPINLTPKQARQLAVILSSTPAGGPTTR